MVAPDEYDMATARAESTRAKQPAAVSARYDGRLRRIVVRLATGLDVAFAPRDAQGLEDADPADLKIIEITPSGLGLHFPKLDADLYLPALLDGYMGSRSWAAARLGEQGGRARSRAKASASRANGRLGGRPLKTA
jgi:hypothetical protein